MNASAMTRFSAGGRASGGLVGSGQVALGLVLLLCLGLSVALVLTLITVVGP